jgi:hypothetical protein
MKNFYSTLLLAFLISVAQRSLALQSEVDSTKSTQEVKKNYSTTLTTRMHSMGFFSFTGRLISDNPAADVYFNYTRNNGVGFQVFKAVDLFNLQSDNNFALGLVFKHIVINKKLTITPYFGGVLEQKHHIVDHGSDFLGQVATSFKVTPHITLDHIALFPSLVLTREYADWINRFRVMYSEKHLDITLWGWNNNKALDDTGYTTAGLSVYYNRIPVKGKLMLGMGVTGLKVLQTSDLVNCPKKDGILLTIAATWH